MPEKCNLCDTKLKTTKALAVHINNKHKEISKEDYYINFISKNDEHLCKVCKNKTTFIGIKNGFLKYCSTKCLNNDPETKEKIKQTNLEKFGCTNPLLNKDVQDKIKKTNLEKYGSENVFDNKEIQEKLKQTNIEKYGVENVSQSEEIKNKKIETTLKNYGISHHMYLETTKDKIKDSNLERYGVENPMQVELFKIKQSESLFKNHSVTSPLKDKDINENMKRTCYDTYFDKFKENDRFKNKVTPLFSKEEYFGDDRKNKYKFMCNECLNEFYDHIDNGKIPRCLNCYPITTGISKGEIEVYEYVKSILPENVILIQSDRTTINPLELDIYIPEYKFAIEYDGLYYHCENSGEKDRHYHYTKTKLCKEQNILLLQIFENEWINKQDVVKSIIRNKLGLNAVRIFARKCVIKEVDKKDVKVFLNDNHLQGAASNRISYGLYFKDELVSLLTMGVSRFNKKLDWEIVRFCSKLNTSVVGGFDKLFKHFVNTHNCKENSITTYSDLRYGYGDVYLKAGFKFINRASSNYFYTNDFINLFSRQKFQKHKLPSQLEKFDINLTEFQNMTNNGWDRIWDCGNNVYIY